MTNQSITSESVKHPADLFGAEAATLPRIMRQGSPDDFQTPAFALGPLLPFLNLFWHIWEPSCGQGNIVSELRKQGYSVTGTDIKDGDSFFSTSLDCDAIVTNPPFTLKDNFLARCYDIGKPFALLLPVTALGAKGRQNMYRKHGLEIIMLGGRINFQTPSGKGSGAWFETAWFTHGLNLGQSLVFANVAPDDGGQDTLFDYTETPL